MRWVCSHWCWASSPFFANDYLGRSMAFEKDNLPEKSGSYRRQVPRRLAEHLLAADYIVSVPTWSPYPESSRAFNLKRRFDLLRSFGKYPVWKKRNP